MVYVRRRVRGCEPVQRRPPPEAGDSHICIAAGASRTNLLLGGDWHTGVAPGLQNR